MDICDTDVYAAFHGGASCDQKITTKTGMHPFTIQQFVKCATMLFHGRKEQHQPGLSKPSN